MLDDLNELRSFERILTLGSLSAAALDQGVSLAVVSKRLTTLERRTGLRLINRTTRNLSATEEGQALLRHVERMLEERDAAEARLASGIEEVRGTLRISAPISLAHGHVAPVAAALVAIHPRLEVELKLDDRLIDLIEARIDVAVRIGQPRDSSAIIRKLADNRRILVAAPSYLDRRARPRTPADMQDHDFLRYGKGSEPWEIETHDGLRADIAAHCRLRADSGEVVHAWAVAGHGVMFKSYVDVAADLASGRLERLLPQWRSAATPIYALFSSSRYIPSKARVFIDALALQLQGT